MADLFRVFRSNHIKPAWQWDAGVLIWRLLFAGTNWIIGEVRDQAKKSTSYFCIDAFSGKPLWKDIAFDEPWWIGIEGLFDRWLILHGYKRPDMPEHRGIRVVDIQSGTSVWKKEELTFWFVHSGRLYAHATVFDRRIGYELDFQTGRILNEYTDTYNELHEIRKAALGDEQNKQHNVIIPELLNSRRREVSIENLIHQIAGGRELDDWIEYLVHKGILLVGYYQKDKSGKSQFINNILSLYDIKKNKIVFKEIIDENMKAPNVGTYMIANDFVYYIKNQTTLTALQPWKS